MAHKNLNTNGTDRIPSSKMGSICDELVSNESRKRQSFERRWYDNNFFDDGFHFRFVSRETGKIVDFSNKNSSGGPLRAIPKASRQIRGIANLLAGPKYRPVIYPERVSYRGYPDTETYKQALLESKLTAQRIGSWVEKTFENLDISNQLTLMMILTAKHGISYMKIYPDPIEEKVCTYVCDAFDVYLEGEKQNISDSSFVTFTKQELIAKIKANKYFDPEQAAMISPDNKYASSEIKEAYMQTRFGNKFASDHTASLIQKETYLKEYVTEFNMKNVVKDLKESARGIEMGDQVIRQVFSAGGITLSDRYVDLSDYPIVDLRFEPGSMYQVPLIERFIPANKTLDSIVSRVEGYANTMGVGVYMKRKGENFKVSNIPGGQVIEYDVTAPQQMNLAPLPAYMFNLISVLEKFIEEQGASTSALGQLPMGVKSGTAIESLKATEYANLQIATDQVKGTVKNITKRLIDLASKYFIKPQTVKLLDKGEPSYFDIVGQRGYEAYKRIGEEEQVQDAIVIKDDFEVDIEIESGLGFTMEGKKQTMQQIATFFMGLAKEGMVSPEVMKQVVEKMLEIYQFGSTQEFLEALEQPADQPMSDEDIQKMKVALAEVLKDTGAVGPAQQQQQVESTKVGVAEVMRDVGAQNKQEEAKAPSKSISFKDLPPEGQAQLAAQAGIDISPDDIQRNKIIDSLPNEQS